MNPAKTPFVLRAAAATAVLVTTVALSSCSSTNAGSTSSSSASGASASASGSGSSAVDLAIGKTGTTSEWSDISSLCGDKPVSVSVVDGFGTNSWSKTVKAEIEAEAAKCSNISGVSYTAARGDLQAQNAAITTAAAKGTNLLLVIPDAGPGQSAIASMKKATSSGTVVVPFASAPSGTAGSDYLDYVDQVAESSGEVWAKWVVDTLGSKGGNVVFLGGPAGAAVATDEFAGVQKVLSANPQIKLLTDQPVTTNWDPAQAQQAMAGLLSKYPKIDAVIADYGASATGAIRAYQAAGVTLPLLTSTDDNSLSCGYADLKAANPGYQLGTISSRTWVGRVALRKALASYQGKSDTEPSLYDLALFEDSTGKASGTKTPTDACLKDAPTDASPSSLLTTAEFQKVFG